MKYTQLVGQCTLRNFVRILSGPFLMFKLAYEIRSDKKWSKYIIVQCAQSCFAYQRVFSKWLTALRNPRHSTRKENNPKPQLKHNQQANKNRSDKYIDKTYHCGVHRAALLTSEFSPNDWWLRNPRHLTRKDLLSPSFNKETNKQTLIPWN